MKEAEETKREKIKRAEDLFINMRVAQKIREARKCNHFTTKQVADCIGIKDEKVRRFEDGKTPVTAEYLFKLAICLDRPVSYFFDDADFYKVPQYLHLETEDIYNSEILRLIEAYYSIKDTKIKEYMYGLMLNLAEKLNTKVMKKKVYREKRVGM